MKKFGVFLTVAVALNDVDAMRPHIAQHSWVTLGYVCIFLVGHMTDMFTLGRIVNNLPVEVL